MSQYVYNKHYTTWKEFCTVFKHSLFLYQKSQSLNFWYVNNSCVNTVRPHFPWSILYIRVAQKPRTTLHWLLLMSITKTKQRTERKQYTTLNATTARQLTLMKPAETLLIDWTQTSDKKWWRQQSHCWTPFTDETSNRLGPCDMYYLFFSLLSTTHFRKLV